MHTDNDAYFRRTMAGRMHSYTDATALAHTVYCWK
jgi:hypothetical protein